MERLGRGDDPNGAGGQGSLQSFWKGGTTAIASKLVKIFVVATFLVFVAKHFVFQTFHIAIKTMATTLLPGDLILVNSFIYWLREPSHGDVIVFNNPEVTHEPRKKVMIRRCIGVAGDRLRIDEHTLVRNGKALIEPYVHGVPEYQVSGTFVMTFPADQLGEPIPRGSVGSTEVTVPKGHILVLDDDRSSSEPLRFWGFLPISEIQGRVFAIYWPPKRIRLIPSE